MTDAEFSEFFEFATSKQLFDFIAQNCAEISFRKVNSPNDAINSYVIKSRGDFLTALEREMYSHFCD
jgi:hypothetical protein